jgi:predicted PurR-regulated permease PerM
MKNELKYYLGTTGSVFWAYFKGQGLVLLILAVLYATALGLIGVKFGILIGICTGFLSIIPYLGFVTGFVVSLVVTTIQFWSNGVISHVLLVLLAFAVIQILESFLITPKIIGKSVGINPIFALVLLILGGMAFGPIGMILSIPCAAVLIKIYKDKIKVTESEMIPKETEE